MFRTQQHTSVLHLASHSQSAERLSTYAIANCSNSTVAAPLLSCGVPVPGTLCNAPGLRLSPLLVHGQLNCELDIILDQSQR